MSKFNENATNAFSILPKLIGKFLEDPLYKLEKQVEDLSAFREEVNNLVSDVKLAFFIRSTYKKWMLAVDSNHAEPPWESNKNWQIRGVSRQKNQTQDVHTAPRTKQRTRAEVEKTKSTLIEPERAPDPVVTKEGRAEPVPNQLPLTHDPKTVGLT